MTEIIEDRFAIVQGKQPRRGGMAEVLEAIDLKTTKKVAIKKFYAERFRGEVSRKTWNRELTALQKLKGHKNIAEILDFGEIDDSTWYIALEWLEETLEDWIGQRNFTWNQYFEQIGQPLLEAIVFAFGEGVAHRDIKPGNLLISNDCLKVVDFGISRFLDLFGSQHTFVQSRSELFSPVWYQDSLHQGKRDVYGFGVVSFCVLSGNLQVPKKLDLKDDNGLRWVRDGISKLALPPDVRDILLQCVVSTPEEVPLPREVLSALDKIEQTRQNTQLEPRQILLNIPPTIIPKVPVDLTSDNKQRTKDNLLTHLNAGFAITYHNADKFKEEPLFIVSTEEYSCLVKIDSTPEGKLNSHKFILLHVRPIYPIEYDDLKDRSLSINDVQFLECTPETVASAKEKEDLYNLIKEFIDFWDQFQESKQVDERYRRIQVWESRLDLEREKTLGASPTIRFINSVQRDRNRSTLTFMSEPPETVKELVGTESKFLIRSENQNWGRVELDDLDGNTADIYSSERNIQELPKSGVLQLDQGLQLTSIERQKNALGAFQKGASLASTLCETLLDPSCSAPPQDVPSPPWFQENLDDDKREAVKAVLGRPTVTVVEGPPGTGKTKLIVETIVQYLKTYPDSKILLSSQTHVALDHVLNQLAGLKPQILLVRIGSEESKKISDEGRGYLLHYAIERWRDEAITKAERFLTVWGEKQGLRKEELQLGLALEKYSKTSAQLETFKEKMRALGQRYESDEKNLEKHRIEGSDKSEINLIQDSLETIEQDRKTLRRRIARVKKEHKKAAEILRELPDGKEYLDLTPIELREWSTNLLDETNGIRKFRELYDLQQAWFARFDDSEEFKTIFLNHCQVVAGTCVGLARLDLEKLEFDLSIIDEASKASPGEAAIPLSKARHWMLVGDPRQLGPFTDIDEDLRNLLPEYPLLNEDILKESILDHFIEHSEATNCHRLSKQYRMVPAIGNLISQMFYEGAVETEPKDSLMNLSAVFEQPVTFFSTSALSNRFETKSKTSYQNLLEVNVIGDLVLRLLDVLEEKTITNFSICLLSGYAAQVTELNRMLLDIPHPDSIVISAGTVDTFQGREADVAIYSVTRSNSENRSSDHHQDRSRLTVALSRGKFALGIVGDVTFCRNMREALLFPDLINYIDNRDDCVIVSAEEPSPRGSQHVPVYRDRITATNKPFAGLRDMIDSGEET